MYALLIDEYLSGEQLLRRAVDGVTGTQLDEHPLEGRWSIRELVCHVADFEIIYADRMKRVIAERQPRFIGGDPDVFAAGLAYRNRSIEDEFIVINAVRCQMDVIFQSLSRSDFQRTGMHPRDGAQTLAELLQRITDHHHIRFVEANAERWLASLKFNRPCRPLTFIEE